MPENPEHGEIVSDQLRFDLFYAAYNRLAQKEMQTLGDDEYIRLKTIEPIPCEESSYFNRLLEKRLLADATDSYLSCEKWTLDINGSRSPEYRVKVLQSLNDHFYSII